MGASPLSHCGGIARCGRLGPGVQAPTLHDATSSGGELRGSDRAAHPPGNSLAAAYAACMLGSGIRCPKRPASPTEAAGSG